MMIVDPREYTAIRWRWRIFHQGGFMTYLEATCDDIAQLAATFQCVVDIEHGAIELL